MQKKIATLFFALSITASAWSQELKLWYRQPAQRWTEALPIGNGRLGAMVFGGVTNDRIQFNEETLWNEGPRDYHREGAVKVLPQIRQLLADGKQREAEALAGQSFMGMRSNEGKREVWVADMKAGKGLQGNPAEAGFDDRQWKTMRVPSVEGWEATGQEGLDGAVWLRTSFELPQNWAGKNLVLELGRVRDQDFTYVNGKLVGTTNNADSRKYTIPAAALVSGTNTLAIQVLNFNDRGGIVGNRDTTRPIGIYAEDAPDQRISLHKQWRYLVQNDNPPPGSNYQADYQPFGDLVLRFPQMEATEYKRTLDLENAVAGLSYVAGGVHYIRQYLASQPHQVVVVRLTADKPGALSFSALLQSPHKQQKVRRVDGRTLGLSVQVRHGALHGESLLRIENKGGSVAVSDTAIAVSGANEVVLYLTAATNFNNYKDVTGNAATRAQLPLQKLQGADYNTIWNAHKQEYQRYFNTFSVNLGASTRDNLPTNERLERFGDNTDPAFAALYMQYGRYLLIASSRPGTRPANLQGIWNDLLSPPWGSKYTTNINAEMNYWPAEVLNMAPMHEPLFGMIEELAQTGRKTAQAHYGAPGWVVHHNTDIWRGAAPINASDHGIWVTGAGWLSLHLWERFLFSQDQQFLRSKAYPLMRDAARFFTHFLVKDPVTGWLISTPSNSPEQGGLVAGPSMDHQIIRNLYRNCIAASKLLGVDAAFRDTLEKQLAQIAPNQIGKYGQLQEWLQDKDDSSNKHRHVSHLWAVHPGSEINWKETPEMMQAAKQSLLYRGDAGTGWSLAWKINFWARFLDGEHSLQLVRMLLSPAAKGGGSYPNLFDAHPPFQIDGNFGGSAGIAEMLLQSHLDGIDLLPALPHSFHTGAVRGIRARGGFTLHYSWKDGSLQQLSVTSDAGQPCLIRYKDKEVRFATQKGKTYHFTGALIQDTQAKR